MIKISPLNPLAQSRVQSSPQFAGTGQNGKVKVVVARDAVTSEYEAKISKLTDVEYVGAATKPDDLYSFLYHEKPDVVVMSSRFNDESRQPILQVLANLLVKLRDEHQVENYQPGVVVHSAIGPQLIYDALDETAQNLSFRHVFERFTVNPGSEFPELQEAIVKADPFKLQTNQTEVKQPEFID